MIDSEPPESQPVRAWRPRRYRAPVYHSTPLVARDDAGEPAFASSPPTFEHDEDPVEEEDASLPEGVHGMELRKDRPGKGAYRTILHIASSDLEESEDGSDVDEGDSDDEMDDDAKATRTAAVLSRLGLDADYWTGTEGNVDRARLLLARIGATQEDVQDNDIDGGGHPDTLRAPTNPTSTKMFLARVRAWHKRGMRGVIGRIYAEVHKQGTILGLSKKHVLLLFRIISLTIEKEIFKALLKGTLAKDAHDPTKIELQRKLDFLMKRPGVHPGIYSNHLVNIDTGVSLTGRQVLQLIDVIKDYPFDDALAYKIDNMFGKTISLRLSNAGWRKYLSRPKDAKAKPLPPREEILARLRMLAFASLLQQLRHRVNSLTEAEKDEPLEPALCEFGYSKSPAKRLKDHAAHRSSNYLMGLFEAGCQHVFPGQGFRIQQHVLYLNVCRAVNGLAEIYFTCLGGAAVLGGGGFTHYPPGISVAYGENASDEKWARWYEDLVGDSDFKGTRDYFLEQDKIIIANLQKTATNLEAAELLTQSLQSDERLETFVRRGGARAAAIDHAIEDASTVLGLHGIPWPSAENDEEMEAEQRELDADSVINEIVDMVLPAVEERSAYWSGYTNTLRRELGPGEDASAPSLREEGGESAPTPADSVNILEDDFDFSNSDIDDENDELYAEG